MPERLIVVATSNDASGLDEALLQRFDIFPFSAGPTFAEACHERLAWIWEQEAAPACPCPWGGANGLAERQLLDAASHDGPGCRTGVALRRGRDRMKEPTDDTFSLTNPPPKPIPWCGPKPENTRQTVLLSGMDCLPGQLDLFATDGNAARTLEEK